MRVLTTGDAVGGVFTYVLELVEGLAEEGVEVVLALSGPAPSDDQRRRLEAAPLAGWEHRPYALEWMDEPWEDLGRADEWLAELVDAVEPDAIHLNSYAHGALDTPIPKLVVGHSCVLSWHEAVRRRSAGREWARYRTVVARGIHGADRLVAPTRALLRELIRLYSPSCPCQTVPNGLAPGALSLLPKEPFVLGVGRVWDEAKNLAALERLAAGLAWPVLLVGEGSSLGRIPEEPLRDLYGRAAIFAEPARYEPFGLSALEAGVCGCALVLGDIPSLREVWGEAALYVDPFDDRSLEQALGRLIEEETERDRLGGAARRQALSYSREQMTAAYLELYERLAIRKRGRTRVGAG